MRQLKRPLANCSCEIQNGPNAMPRPTGQLAGDIGTEIGGKSVLSPENGHFGPDIDPIFSFWRS
jgi:hypothetical protein